jgi:hypothetical protein
MTSLHDILKGEMGGGYNSNLMIVILTKNTGAPMLRSKFLLLYLNVLDLNAEMVSRLENKFGTAFMTWMRGSKCAEWQRKAIR